MKIAFVCNQNQARSQVLSSVFRSLIPTSDFDSFGLIALEGTPLPSVIDSIFRDWGLDPGGRVARNLGIHWDETKNLEVIVAVTSFIAEEVKNMGFRGEILDLESEANRLGIAVMDPQLMQRRQCAYELAKYLKVCVSAFKRTGLMETGPNIVAFLPEREAAIDKAVSMAIAQLKVGSSVLLGDLIAPVSPLVLDSHTPLSRFKVNEATSSVDLLVSPEWPGILLPTSAAMNPAKVYLGKPWLEFMLKIATESLIIVTPPEKNTTGRLAESYLAALYAHEVRMVTT